MNNKIAPIVLGRSFLLEDGDFVFEQGAANLRDFKFVAGRDNLVQGLKVMIETGFGSDAFNVNYGLDVKAIFTTAQTTRSAKDLIRLNLVKSISQDDRVTLIKEVVFDDDPRYYELLPAENATEHTQTRQNARQWQALVVMQTIAEGEVALRLEGTGLTT